MDKKIQLIGLPCSGKSTFLKKYLSKRKNISSIDIRDFNEETCQKSRTRAFIKQIKKSRGNIICESACGVNLSCTEVVKLDTPIAKIYDRTQKREGELDEEYISLLESCMIPSKYNVKDIESLERILDKLFNINLE